MSRENANEDLQLVLHVEDLNIYSEDESPLKYQIQLRYQLETEVELIHLIQ